MEMDKLPAACFSPQRHRAHMTELRHSFPCCMRWSRLSLDMQRYTGISFFPTPCVKKVPVWCLWLSGISPLSSAFLYQHQERAQPRLHSLHTCHCLVGFLIRFKIKAYRSPNFCAKTTMRTFASNASSFLAMSWSCGDVKNAFFCTHLVRTDCT